MPAIWRMTSSRLRVLWLRKVGRMANYMIARENDEYEFLDLRGGALGPEEAHLLRYCFRVWLRFRLCLWRRGGRVEIRCQDSAGDLGYAVGPRFACRRDGRQSLRETARPPLRLLLDPFAQAVDECDWFDGGVGLEEENCIVCHQGQGGVSLKWVQR